MFKTTVILFGLTLGLLSTTGRATTYYLDSASGNDFHAGTSVGAALKTLQGASANLYHPGDQILLKAGSVYTGETLNITTSDEDGAPVVVGSYGAGNQPVLDSGTRTSINLSNSRNVVVSGLTIKGSGETLVSVSGGSNNTVEKCNITGGSTFPIHISNSPGFKFLNNTYTSTGGLAGDALRADTQVSGLTISGNKFTLSGSSHSACGIYILDVDNAVISSNVVTGGSQAIGIKGYTRSVTGAQIYSNTVSGTDDSGGGDGESIEFTGVTRMGPRTVSGTIHDNVVKEAKHAVNAIAAYSGTNITAYNNTVSGPLSDAAFHWTTDSKNGVIHNNTIYKSGIPNTFVVLSGSSAQIYSNTIK